MNTRYPLLTDVLFGTKIATLVAWRKRYKKLGEGGAGIRYLFSTGHQVPVTELKDAQMRIDEINIVIGVRNGRDMQKEYVTCVEKWGRNV